MQPAQLQPTARAFLGFSPDAIAEPTFEELHHAGYTMIDIMDRLMITYDQYWRHFNRLAKSQNRTVPAGRSKWPPEVKEKAIKLAQTKPSTEVARILSKETGRKMCRSTVDFWKYAAPNRTRTKRRNGIKIQ